jgi:vesicle coat complex subunit
LSQGEILTLVNKKLTPSLGMLSSLNTVTLLASEPEVQYVVLRNIGVILQKRPYVLSQEIRVFFTKYNDPPYVKLEKLDIILKLSNEGNIDQVLSELKE